MDIKILNNTIKTTFDYEYIDSNGDSQSEPIELEVRRLTYKEATSKDFQNKARKIQNNPELMASFICDFLKNWSLENDGAELPITKETVESFPIDLTTQLSQKVMSVVTGIDSGK